VYPQSPYAYPIGSFQVPQVPPTDPPTAGPFFYIPVNCTWMSLITGALQQLLLQSTWNTDPDTLAIVQGWVFDLIAQFNCATALTLEQLCGSMPDGGDCDMGCCLRFQDGKLQQLDCGVWVDVAGQSNLPVGPLQPADGAPQPQPGGGCDTYHATMIASQQWLVPTPVSTGDQINVTDFNGASHEAGAIFWYGPNGQRYFAGNYEAGTEFTSGTDPVPTAPHQSLIIGVGGSFYQLVPGPFSVPVGVTNEQPVIYLNTDTPADLSGTVQFDVEVCNNQAGTFIHVFDFTAGTQGWEIAPIAPTSVGANGVYDPGFGFRQGFVSFPGVAGYRLIEMFRTVPTPTQFNQYQVFNTAILGASTGSILTDDVQTVLSGSNTSWSSTPFTSLPPSPWLIAHADINADTLALSFVVGSTNDGSDPGGSVLIPKIVVFGIGTDPFI